MIKLRNLDDMLVDLSVPDTQTAAANKRVFVVPFNCTLKAIYAKLGTAGTTDSEIVDIHKNGTTIFGTSVKLTFATTKTNCTYSTVTDAIRSLKKGDILTVDVDSIHSGVAAANLALLLVLSRVPTAKLETDTIGTRNE